jgi:hypothetical protein
MLRFIYRHQVTGRGVRVSDWLLLLGGSLLFGAALVATMVVHRALVPLAVLVTLGAFGSSLMHLAAVFGRYGTVQAVGAGVLFVMGGAGIGYTVAAALLPHLARRPRVPVLPDVPPGAEREAIVLIATTEPERYSVRSVAARHVRHIGEAGMDISNTATPFVFLAEKARYGAVRGKTSGPAVARGIAARVSDALEATGSRAVVSLAWTHEPDSLAQTVARRAAEGIGRIAVVPLGFEDSDEVEHAKAILDRAHPRQHGVHVAFGPPVWHDTTLAERLVSRVLACTRNAEPSATGVVLVGEGVPPEWERRHNAARCDETYFNQRVRLLLGEHGIDDRAIRIGWLDWQMPDVTEAVRHVGALGKTRIVVAPSMIALPTLAATVDLGHAVELARLPREVEVVTLLPWGDDEAFSGAVTRSAMRALESLRGPVRP